MLALLELLLSEIAPNHRVAALIDAISEVLAGHADHTAFPALKVMVVDKIPLLHHPSEAVQQYWKGKWSMVKQCPQLREGSQARHPKDRSLRPSRQCALMPMTLCLQGTKLSASRSEAFMRDDGPTEQIQEAD